MKAFQAARPRILGALLDTVAGALHHLPTTDPPNLPRMADFAIWVAAAEASLGWPKGTFLSAYAGNRASANEVALEASPIAQPLIEMFDEQGEWVGTSSELLQALEARVGDQVKRQRVWPSNGRSMTGHLKRLSPNLRAAGWQIEFHRESSRRLWSIRRQATLASSDSFASQEGQPTTMQNDAKSCKLLQNDANDGRDANAGTQGSTPVSNDDGWEEGKL